MATLLQAKLNRSLSKAVLKQLIEFNLPDNTPEYDDRILKRPISLRHITDADFEIYLRKLYALGYKSRVFKEYIRYQFECVYTPAWFGAVVWYPFPKNYPDACEEPRHFNNKLFPAVKKIYPFDIDTKPRIIWLHERTHEIINPYSNRPVYRRAYRSHFHLEDIPGINTAEEMNQFLQDMLRPNFIRLSRRDTKLNKAITVLDWNYERHCTYNSKDYFKRSLDDNDLVLDYLNSDLGMIKQVKGLLPQI